MPAIPKGAGGPLVGERDEYACRLTTFNSVPSLTGYRIQRLSRSL